MTPGNGSTQRRDTVPSSIYACDAVVVGFAAWTLCCQAVVLAGGGLRDLLWVAVPVVLTTLLLLRRLPPPPPVETDGAAPAGRWPVLAAGGAAAVGAAYGLTGSVWLAWTAALLILATAWALHARLPEPAWVRARRSTVDEAVLWSLCAAGALIPLLVQLPNEDDAYYLNVMVAAVDDPTRALLRTDSLYGINGLPIMLPIYAFQSFELLGAAIAYVSPLTATQAAHWVVPAAFGGFVPLAIARLCRLLTPRIWLWTTLATLAVLLLGGETPYSHAGNAFVRLHQGKGALVTAMMPLVLFYAAAFARAGGARSWLLLASAQIGAVGANATALWAAPVFAGLALVAAATLDGRGLARVAIGATASLQPLALALFARREMASILDSFAATRWLPDTGGAGGALLRGAVERVLGDGAFGLACLGASLAAWGMCRSAFARRFLLGLVLGFLIVLFDPLISDLVARHLTSEISYFRLLWFVPVPVLLAIVLVAPLELAQEPGRGRIAAAVAVAGASVVVLGALPAGTALDIPHYYKARVEFLGLKVHPEAYEAAGLLAAQVPSGSVVLAPSLVSVWVGTFPHHPYAVVPRDVYLEYLRGHVSPGEIERRRRLASIFLPPSDLASWNELRRELDRYPVQGVAVPDIPDFASLLARLEAWGYARGRGNRQYSIWVRTSSRHGGQSAVSRSRIGAAPRRGESQPGERQTGAGGAAQRGGRGS